MAGSSTTWRGIGTVERVARLSGVWFVVCRTGNGRLLESVKAFDFTGGKSGATGTGTLQEDTILVYRYKFLLLPDREEEF